MSRVPSPTLPPVVKEASFTSVDTRILIPCPCVSWLRLPKDLKAADVRISPDHSMQGTVFLRFRRIIAALAESRCCTLQMLTTQPDINQILMTVVGFDTAWLSLRN